MTYSIEVTRSAKQDMVDAVLWYAENNSEDYAARWYEGLQKAIRTLASNPDRCAFVRENRRLSADVRRLLYGNSKKTKHRVVFTIENSQIFVLRVRHSAQKDLRNKDLPKMHE